MLAYKQALEIYQFNQKPLKAAKVFSMIGNTDSVFQYACAVYQWCNNKHCSTLSNSCSAAFQTRKTATAVLDEGNVQSKLLTFCFSYLGLFSINCVVVGIRQAYKIIVKRFLRRRQQRSRCEV